MITKKQKQTLEDLYRAMREGFDSIDTVRYAERTYEQNLREARDHDRMYRGSSIKRGMTLKHEAMYFLLMRYAKYKHLNEKAPDPATIHHYMLSCYYAYAMAQDTREDPERFATVYKEQLLDVATWDYCDLIAE